MAGYFTIGHSTHPAEEFIAMLRTAGVRFVADVRTMPRSRTNPQFNTDVLPAALADAQIGYEHIAALGGLRSRRRDVDPQVNGFWENKSFHNYADYAMGDAFQAGFQHLREIGRERPVAIMCAEAVWWRCHRRIIADYLLAAGEDVRHIMADGKIIEARMTNSAQREGDVLAYPA
ncbi:MAG TPA: DUF488 domain-containing protein [Burkholderiales bacterium]|nr:DUF488 domain-containing protein [Burkholderiales bacterium]